MAADAKRGQPAVATVLLVVLAGMAAVVVSLWVHSTLIGEQATHAEALRRMGSFIRWTQPFIYLGAGMLAGYIVPRGATMRAPVVGLFLASFCWLLVRRLNLLPPDPNAVGFMVTAGALFALLGSFLAGILGDRTPGLVGLLAACGILAWVAAYFNLGGLPGQVQHEVIQRAQGMTVAMTTEPVPGVTVSLLDPVNHTELYVTTSSDRGRYNFQRIPLGEYMLHTVYGAGRDRKVIQKRIKIQRTIMGGTPWETIALPAVVREAGRIFE